MAGGKGTRLKVPEEKPLFKLRDKPLINFVLENLKASKLIDEIVNNLQNIINIKIIIPFIFIPHFRRNSSVFIYSTHMLSF